ncbi:ABC transporter substrate-binding protein [Mobilicoccus caccae]|uniref:Amino acid ABC transporter substrate-binding protein n=1 Tax=Mobilicoccus caccae TaxID=1859295 RepID=A0ABQ6INU0_9MICO|nr:ABC transporter substrate-binding protein [Mobilicoccus caccae]GMA39416.1 amino acid ABC transporter substrate-binding protein [Mobilicoccus caccae]
MRFPRLVPLVFPLLALAACSAPTDGGGAQPGAPATQAGGSQTGASGASDACGKEHLELTTPGSLTIGTDTPAYEPWFLDDEPSNGEGYESAVAYAIAERLGFERNEVTWVDVPFNTAIAPGPKKFDFDLNQISIKEDRKQAVDFSSGYYDVRQAVVTYKGSPIDGRQKVADLASARLGAQVGTTSYSAITEQIKPSAQPNVFDTNDLAVQALKNRQIDGVVVDLPTAFYMTSVQLDDGVIVGQLPAGAEAEQFGAVLDKESSLTTCVSGAVDSLREDGTLEKLEQQWLSRQGAPELS